MAITKPSGYAMECMHFEGGSPHDDVIPTAVVQLIGPDGTSIRDTSTGSNIVEAVCNALNRTIGVDFVLKGIDSITVGDLIPFQVVLCVASNGGNVEIGIARSKDPVVAIAKAYLNAVNALLRDRPLSPEDAFKLERFGVRGED